LRDNAAAEDRRADAADLGLRGSLVSASVGAALGILIIVMKVWPALTSCHLSLGRQHGDAWIARRPAHLT
jgi:hypothetical protein